MLVFSLCKQHLYVWEKIISIFHIHSGKIVKNHSFSLSFKEDNCPMITLYLLFLLFCCHSSSSLVFFSSSLQFFFFFSFEPINQNMTQHENSFVSQLINLLFSLAVLIQRGTGGEGCLKVLIKLPLVQLLLLGWSM